MNTLPSAREAARAASTAPRRPRHDVVRRLRRSKVAVGGSLLVVALFAIAAVAPSIAPYGGTTGNLSDRLQGPSTAHLFGTDLQGRDELSRVILGARISLFTGGLAVILAAVAGIGLGTVAGALPGKVDAVVMRTVDVLLAVPGILMAIGVVAWLGRGLPQIMVAVGIAYAPRFARLLRGTIVQVRELEYVIAGVAAGASWPRIVLRHILPNSITPVLVAATLSLGTAIIDIAGLGFLGLGPPDPATPEWGTMLTDARQFLLRAPHLLFFPGLAIVLCAAGFNLLGDGLREALDPRARR